MATIKLKTADAYLKKLEKLAGSYSKTVYGRAIYAGAEIVADEIRKNIDALPTEDGWPKPGVRRGISRHHKGLLQEALGITNMDKDRRGVWNVKIGFDGYADVVTRRWPKGQPIQMIARAVESGTSWLEKHPFVRPAVNKTRKAAQQAMAQIVQREIEIMMQ